MLSFNLKNIKSGDNMEPKTKNDKNLMGGASLLNTELTID